jgi:hypothetical protein
MLVFQYRRKVEISSAISMSSLQSHHIRSALQRPQNWRPSLPQRALVQARAAGQSIEFVAPKDIR